MENKEIAEKLIAYFLTQSHKDIATALALMSIDFTRIANADTLPEKELQSLYYRIQLQSKQLQDFVQNGAKGDLNFINITRE